MQNFLRTQKNKLCIIFIGCVAPLGATQHTLSSHEKEEIGMQIWHNEAGKRYDRLVFWKENEKFPSLGICHFIWYPHRNADIYTQTFPDLLTYFKKKKVKLPAWLAKAKYAPWKTKEAFDTVAQSAQVQELRKLMHNTIDLQVEFIMERLQKAWPRILKSAHPDKRKLVEENYHALMQTPQGVYALLDYLNFKGEGTDPKERYNGVGWGLLDVLQTMPKDCLKKNNEIEEFINAAKNVLSTRMKNAPAHKAHEKEWLQGWHNRVNSYKTFTPT